MAVSPSCVKQADWPIQSKITITARRITAPALSFCGKKSMQCWVRFAGRLIPIETGPTHSNECNAVRCKLILVGRKVPVSTSKCTNARWHAIVSAHSRPSIKKRRSIVSATSCCCIHRGAARRRTKFSCRWWQLHPVSDVVGGRITVHRQQYPPICDCEHDQYCRPVARISGQRRCLSG